MPDKVNKNLLNQTLNALSDRDDPQYPKLAALHSGLGHTYLFFSSLKI